MSRAFVREDADSERLIVPQRAPLPDGQPNLVTRRGMRLLEREHSELSEQIRKLQAQGEEAADFAGRMAVLQEQHAELEDRLATARLVEPPAEPTDEVRFGALVTARAEDGSEMSFRIVGVDEADPFEGLVSFTAPTASALLGHRVGDSVTVALGRGEQVLTVVAVAYPAEEEAETEGAAG